MKELDGTDTYENLYDTWDSILKEHIEGVMTGIKAAAGVDSIYAYDVVNEEITWTKQGWARRTFDDTDHAWYSRMHDYVEKAFTYARAADPNTKLFYNDFAMERYSGKNRAVFNLVQSLVDKGVPIDGVGFQMHIRPDWALTREKLAALFKQYGDLGLEVHVTELDIELCPRTNGVETICDPNDPENLQAQADLYRDVLAACYIDNPGVCTAFLTWGIYDGLTWLDMDGGRFHPLLYDENFEKKPAYHAIFDLLTSTADECASIDDMPQEAALTQVEAHTSSSMPHGIDDMFAEEALAQVEAHATSSMPHGIDDMFAEAALA